MKQLRAHRAVEANNINVVLVLLDEFRANPLKTNQQTGETILHTACRMKSDLRFFIVNRYPDLLRKRNMKTSEAELPLHVACAENDIDFVSWLFKNTLAEESEMDEVGSIPGRENRFRSESLASIETSSVRKVCLESRHPLQQGGERRMTDNHGLISYKRTSLLPAIGEGREGSGRSRGHSPVPDDPYYDGMTFRIDKENATNEGDANPEHSVTFSSISSVRRRSLQKMKMEDILKESPLTVSEVCSLLTSLTSSGDSVFHILARGNYPKLLTCMFKVAEFVYWRIDLNMLLCRYKHTSYLPIEEAIHAKSVECIEVIIHFMNISGQLLELLQDDLLLKRAVHDTDLDIVKVFINYGFHKGLQSAISQAVQVKSDEILRVLLYYETEVINALESSRITHDQVRTLHPSNGIIKWEGCHLDHLDSRWLDDCYDAVSSVSKAFSLIHVVLSTDDNHHFFQRLGQDCLQYFSRMATTPVSKQPQHLSVITNVSLNNNRLTEVPLELFQLPSLRSLQLSNNNLQCLPLSSNSLEKVYTSPIVDLDLDYNNLKTIPERLFRDLAHTLTELNASCNSLEDLPPGLWISPKLIKLRVAHNHLSRLHYLSDTRYFNNQELSSTILSSLTVSSGILVCNNPLKNENLCQVIEYMHKLADFRLTVCEVKFPCNAALSSHNNTMYDIMGIHLSRSEFYRTSSSGIDQRTQSTPTIEGEPLFPMDNGEEKESLTCVLEELDLSHNDFDKFPWDLPCVAPQLKKLHIEKNQIQDLDIIHGVPKDIESLFLGKNNIGMFSSRPKSLPCGHPFRLLTIPDSNNSHDRYCRHCKHEALDNLLLLSINQNQLREFPTTQQLTTADSASQMGEPLYPNLSILSLDNNKLQEFPAGLHLLTKLKSVKLSHNEIRELPPEVGLLNSQQLIILSLEGMNLRNIPPHLLKETTPKQLLNYLKAIQHK